MHRCSVLIAVQSLDHGGCERDAAKLAVGLDRNRFTPHVAVLKAGGFRTAEVEAAGVPILNLAVNSFLNSSAFRGAKDAGGYIRQHGIQVIHALDVPTDIFMAPLARYYRVPVLITSQLSFRNMYPRGTQMALRITDWLSDCVVVNSRAVGRSLEHEVNARKIFLSYNGVNPQQFHPGCRASLPALEGASLVIGSVCVMRQEKRMDWVIRSFATVQKQSPGIHLLLVGSGPEMPRLMELRDSLGLHDCCHFQPGQADVAPWMRSMDIYINSSYSESFPNALLEAMASGCCAIGSNVGGIPELITHLADGLIFESDKPDSLTEMLTLAVSDTALRESLRLQAVNTAHQRFSMQLALERMEALYQALLQKHGVSEAALAC